MSNNWASSLDSQGFTFFLLSFDSCSLLIFQLSFPSSMSWIVHGPGETERDLSYIAPFFLSFEDFELYVAQHSAFSNTDVLTSLIFRVMIFQMSLFSLSFPKFFPRVFPQSDPDRASEARDDKEETETIAKQQKMPCSARGNQGPCSITWGWWVIFCWYERKSTIKYESWTWMHLNC